MLWILTAGLKIFVVGSISVCLVDFNPKNVKVAAEFQCKFSMFLAKSLRLFQFDKINPTFMLLFYHWPIIASKWYHILFCKSKILLEQPIALLEGVSAHFWNVHCSILKEMRGCEILNVKIAAGLIPLKLGLETSCRIFRQARAQKIADLTKSIFFRSTSKYLKESLSWRIFPS